MWKFQDFSVIQILREIIFGEGRTFKSTVFAILGALNFVFRPSENANIHGNQNSKLVNVF